MPEYNETKLTVIDVSYHAQGFSGSVSDYLEEIYSSLRRDCGLKNLEN